MIRWTGLAPWEFELPFPDRLTSTFLVKSIVYERVIRCLSGSEVHYTNLSISLVKNMLCSELHSQKAFYLIIFSYKMSHSPPPSGGRAGRPSEKDFFIDDLLV